MKRGQLPLESIIQIILRVLGVAVLVALVVLLVRIFLPTGSTPEEIDFKRVVGEFEELMNEPFTRPLTVAVPVVSKVQVYATECDSRPCICMTKGQDVPPKCQVFASLKSVCPADCVMGSKAHCITPGVAVRGSTNSITIKRSCNAIGFEGIQV